MNLFKSLKPNLQKAPSQTVKTEDHSWPNSTVLLHLDDMRHPGKTYPWTQEDAFAGVSIKGGPGSGKTSGSGRMFYSAMMLHGWGGLVCCVKPEEAEDWVALAKKVGRHRDIIRLGLAKSDEATKPGTDYSWRFNYMDYMYQTTGRDTQNCMDALMAMNEVGKSTGSGASDEWKTAAENHLKHIISIIGLAGLEMSMKHIMKINNSLPGDTDDLTDKEFKEKSFAWSVLRLANENLKALEFTPQRDEGKEEAFDYACHYLTKKWAAYPSGQKSGIGMMISGIVDTFATGPLNELFCKWGEPTKGTMSLLPEMAFNGGAIIIVDMPTLRYKKLGLFANVLMKYAFQQAATRRFEDIFINGKRLNPSCPDKKKARPCFLVADEHQDVFDMRDSDFQTINRAYKIAPIYLTQNLPNYYKKCPNRDAVDTLDANLQTQVCHHNGCPVTNEHMSKKIGKAMRVTSTSRSNNASSQGQQGGSSTSSTRTEESIVKPSEFTKLRKGGPVREGEIEGWFTEAILWKSGEQFGSEPYLKMKIDQTLI